MCGIYGYIGIAEYGLYELKDSINRISHRGPDDQGYKVSSEIGISMCRLAINELQTGHQPYISRDERYGVVFNGEIYNYKELANLIGLPKHTSEAEIIWYLFNQKGPDFVKELDGMFAIAIADFFSKKLYLFRDPFGEKPLWIFQHINGAVEFASEIKAFHGAKSIRQEFVSEYLTFGYVPFNKSAYHEITSIPAGSYSLWEDGVISHTKYWEISENQHKNIDYQDAKIETFRLLTEAVNKRLISERPIGVFLSGGYDSSVIAAIMKNVSNTEVNSYTIGFENIAFDESTYAQQVSKAVGTIHHEEICTFNVAETVVEIFKKIDLPFADSSIIPTFLLNNMASKDIVVALGGDGGDEIFGGYDRYLFAPVFEKYPKFNWLIPKNLPPISEEILKFNRKIERFNQVKQASTNLSNNYLAFLTQINKAEMSEITKSRFFDFENKFNSDFESRQGSYLRKMMLSDVNNYLPGDLLVKADLASMFNSIEVRSPMLDRDLAKFTYSLPDRFLVNKFKKKIILKDIAHELIPRDILDRPKMGFGVPMNEWLRRDLSALMLSTFAKNRGILDQWINMDEIDQLVARQMAGEDLARILWPIFALALWIENYS